MSDASMIWPANDLTGGTYGTLDKWRMDGAGNPKGRPVKNGDRAFVILSTGPHYFVFNSSATDATNITTRPFKIRPVDYIDHGVWEEVTDWPLSTGDVDDAPVDGETGVPISSNWAFDHVAAADPHTGYRLESADHTHQSTGAQAGTLDHGLALTGLGDDDHTIYELSNGSRGSAGIILMQQVFS